MQSEASLWQEQQFQSESKMSVCIIIPCYNEAGGLASTLSDLVQLFEEHDLNGKVLIVDDGSTDDTEAVAKEYGAQVVRHLENRGYGHALRTGIMYAPTEYIAICDADGTYPVNRLPDLLAELEKGYDLVIGARTGKSFRGSTLKFISRKFFKMMCESASGTKIPDANSGLRVFRRSTITPNLNMMCGGFSFTTSQTLCFLLLSRSVKFMPIEYAERIGKTKVRHVRDALRTAQYIVSMYVTFNPLKLFVLLAAIPFLLGFATLAAQLGLNAFGEIGNWETTIKLASLFSACSFMTFMLGLLVFGINRQRSPDLVTGAQNAPPPRRPARQHSLPIQDEPMRDFRSFSSSEDVKKVTNPKLTGA